MATEIRVPTLGESVTEATVAKWFKSVGDAVSADEPLVELETDKVTVEVPAPSAGTLEQISAAEGNDVEVGSLLGAITDGAGAAKPAARTAPPKAAKPAVPAPAAAPATAAATVDVVVPELGESVTEGTIAKWFKQLGEAVAADEPLVEVETDKVTVEVPAPTAGTLAEILAADGSDIEVGAVIGRLAAGAGAPATAPQAAASPPPPPAAALAPAPVAAAAAARAPSDAPLAPAVRRLVEEHRLDPLQIPASGKGGRLTKGDVLAFLEAPPPSVPAPVAPAVPAVRAPAIMPVADLPPRAPDPRGEERVRMTKLRRTIAARLKDAQNTAAMLTTFNEVDMTAVTALRSDYRDAFEKKHGMRLGFMSFFVKAAVTALKELPAVNGEIYGDEVIYKNFYDIGIAVGSPQGLVVPVLRDADAQAFAEIETNIADFGRRARDGKLTMAELTGGTFTVTNGGIFGSLLSTPILNPPQSGILGMHKIQKRPMAVGDQVVVRPMMYLALSYDHRIIDGREAVTFLVRIKDAIEDPQRLMLNV